MSKKKPKKRRFLKIIKNLALLGLGGVFLAGGAVLILLTSLEIPTLESFQQRKVVNSTKIFDRTGEILLYDIHEDVRRTVVPSEEISDNAKMAVVAIEDDTFYEHKGVEIKAIIRAIVVNLREGEIAQGGSTITQQVVKNALLTGDKRITRKIKEWILAPKIEQALTKDEILTLYLNEIPYGGTIYGIEEASNKFFRKKASELTVAESAYLAAIPQAPTFFSPYGNNKDKLDDRKNLVLSLMKQFDMITEEEYVAAREEEVEFAPRFDNNLKAPHFVLYVREYLENKYGRDVVLQDGLRVITTLDYELQETAERLALEQALKNQEEWNASNTSVVAIDSETGQILTLVGSRNYFDGEIDGNFNVAIAERQPGSSFKPFVYAAGFEKGYTIDTVLFDTRTQFANTRNCGVDDLHSEGECYSPVNFDNDYKGPMTLRNALGQSRNVPAVKLLYLVGVENAIRTAQRMGITTLDKSPEYYGLTIVLGGGEATLLEMTGAYATFSNEGIYNKPSAILKVTDKDGNVLEEFTQDPRNAISREAAAQVSEILSDNVARTPLFGAWSGLYFGPNIDVAGKTGTTNNRRDGWLMGYTDKTAVGVWTGNNDNTSMEKGSSVSIPLWRAVMDEVIAKYPPGKFPEPPAVAPDTKPVLRGVWEGGETYEIDIISGKLATEFTPIETRETRVVGSPHNILHWVNPDDPTGPIPSNPTSDSQYLRWEIPVINWMVENRPEFVGGSGAKPTEYDDVHTPETIPNIQITQPQSGNIFNKELPITIQTSITSTYDVKEVQFFLNDTLIGSTSNQPFSFTFRPADLEQTQSLNTLKAVVIDQVYSRNETTLDIAIQ